MADVPLVAGGSIHVPTEDTGTPSLLAPAEIVRRAMRIVGTQTDPNVRLAGYEALQECVNDINIRNSFDFTITKDTDLPLVADQRDYDIPTAAFALKEVVLVKDSETPEVVRPIGYIDWDQLHNLFEQADSGFPNYWTARDVFINRKITLPVPASDTIVDDGWKLRIYYRTAVVAPPLNDPNVRISGPEVISSVIQIYIEFRLLELFGDPNDPRTPRKYRQYRDMLVNLRGMETRSRPGLTQIRPNFPKMGSTGFLTRRAGSPWE